MRLTQVIGTRIRRKNMTIASISVAQGFRYDPQKTLARTITVDSAVNRGRNGALCACMFCGQVSVDILRGAGANINMLLFPAARLAIFRQLTHSAGWLLDPSAE